MPRTSDLGKVAMPPKMPLSESVEWAKKIVGQFGSHEFSDGALASLLGHDTAKSGSFRQRQADLRRFGIIDGRGDKLHASMSAKTISAPGPGELSGALSQTAFRIPLYRSLHDKYKGAVPTEEDFLTTLVDITGLARSDLMPHVKTLLGLYTDVCRTLGMAPPNPTAPPSRSFEHPAPGSLTTGARFESSTADYQFSVADEPEAIESVITQLQARKTILERRLGTGKG